MGYAPMPSTFPLFMSWLNGNSAAISCVVAMTRGSMGAGTLPPTLIRTGPLVPCTEGVYSPVVLWLSAGGTTFSLYIEDAGY